MKHLSITNHGLRLLCILAVSITKIGYPKFPLKHVFTDTMRCYAPFKWDMSVGRRRRVIEVVAVGKSVAHFSISLNFSQAGAVAWMSVLVP